MKKILILGTLIATILSSCSDFIEEENLSNVTAESFYVTSLGFQSLVNANYAQLRDIYGNEPYLFCAGTDLYAEGRGDEPDGLAEYTQLTPSSSGVDHLYNTCYEAIQLANRALYYSKITEQTDDLSTLVAEVKFLRANAYFLLVQTYGGVAITDYIDSPILSFDRDSAEDVYESIITDLTEAIEDLGTEAYNGKVNKRAAKNLLSKVYLTRAYEDFAGANDFSLAASLADEVIANQALNLPYELVFTPENDINEEVIFSVQFSKGSVSTNPTGLGSRQFYYFGSYLGGAEVAGKAPNRSYTLCPSDFALGLYTSDDTRWEATFMTEIFDEYYNYYRVDKANHSDLPIRDFYEPQWFTSVDEANYLATKNLAVDFVYHQWGEYSSEYTLIQALDYQTICVKKFDDPDPTTPFSSGRASTRDIILSRLAETYLVAAEAYLQTNPATGLARLNEVRRRAGVSPATLGEFDIDYILDERARELLGEYHRWFDLKRTGKLVERASLYNRLVDESNFVGTGGNLKILRPIPQGAIDLNQNRDFPQNPAYE